MLTLLCIADPKKPETADSLRLRHIDEVEGGSSSSLLLLKVHNYLLNLLVLALC